MRKAKIIAIGLVLTVAAVVWAQTVTPRNLSGQLVDPGSLHTFKPSGIHNWLPAGWQRLSAFTAATTTPDVSHRTYTTFDDDAQNRVLVCDSRWNKVVVRALGTTNNATITVDVFLMVGGTSDHFTRIGTLAFVVGQQPSSVTTYEFADAVSVTNETGSFRSWRAISPGGDYIGMGEVDLCPGDILGFCPTGITAGTAILEVCGY